MGRGVGSVVLPEAKGGPDKALVVNEREDADVSGDGSRACCGGRVKVKWTDSWCAAGSEEGELDEGHCDKVWQRRALGGGPMVEDIQNGESMHDASIAPIVCWVQDWHCVHQCVSAVCCGYFCAGGVK